MTIGKHRRKIFGVGEFYTRKVGFGERSGVFEKVREIFDFVEFNMLEI